MTVTKGKQHGGEISAVAQSAIASIQEMRRALRDAKPGDRIRLGKLYRAGEINCHAKRGEDGKSEATFELTFSSEFPVERFFGTEILSHEEGAVRMDWVNSARAPIHVGHRHDELPVGVIESAEIRDRKGHATIRFNDESQAGREAQAGVTKDISRNVSVGYWIHKIEIEENLDTDERVITATDWEPLEVSIVGVPADPTVSVDAGAVRWEDSDHETEVIEVRPGGTGSPDDAGAGASGETDTRIPDIVIVASTPNKEGRTMDKDTTLDQPSSSMTVRGPGGDSVVTWTEKDDPRDVQKKLESAIADQGKRERVRVEEILALGTKHNLRKLSEEHIGKGTTVESFRAVVLENIADGVALYDIPSDLDLSKQERKQYSIFRAARALARPYIPELGGQANLRKAASYEFELSQAIADRAEREPDGIFVPNDVISPLDVRAVAFFRMLNSFGAASTPLVRDLLAGSGEGPELVETMNLGFADVLRNIPVVSQMGATIMRGLVGNVDIPRMTAGASAGWIATEGGAAAEQTQTLDQVQLRPRDLGAFTDITRRLLLQSDPSAEAVVRNDLQLATAVGIDAGAINGSGASGQPTGILNTSGIGAADAGANGGALTWDNVTRNFENVAVANALRGRLGWIMSGAAIAHGMRTVRVSGQPRYIVEEPQAGAFPALMSFPVGVSENVPSNLTKGTGTSLTALIMGAFQDVIIGEWGTLDLLVDPFTASSTGTVRIRVLQTIDVQLRYAGAFSATDDINTT